MTPSTALNIRDLIADRIKTAPLRELLELTRPEPKQIQLIKPRFEIVDDEIVLDHKTGLMWARDYVPGGRRSWHESIDAAAKFDLRGWQWRAPTIEEQLSIVDYTRRDPAFDTDYFKGDASWVWTSTELALSSVCAWFVSFSGGDSYWNFRYFSGLVRAVRVGQF